MKKHEYVCPETENLGKTFIHDKYLLGEGYWLSELINLSFNLGIFPDILKIAKERKLNFQNYSYLFLLRSLKKLFTRDFTFTFFTKLVGFRNNYSTNHVLTSITKRIKDLVDSGNFVCGVCVDLEKAFNTVNHKIRKQFVSIDCYDSVLRDLICGVPQGSSLGPLLFLLYINDFRLCLHNSESGHFADDTYVLFGSNKLGTIESVVNYELKLVSKWLRLNKLSLNAGKTKLVFFRSKNIH